MAGTPDRLYGDAVACRPSDHDLGLGVMTSLDRVKDEMRDYLGS